MFGDSDIYTGRTGAECILYSLLSTLFLQFRKMTRIQPLHASFAFTQDYIVFKAGFRIPHKKSNVWKYT
jgi:hypothetical protein